MIQIYIFLYFGPGLEVVSWVSEPSHYFHWGRGVWRTQSPRQAPAGYVIIVDSAAEMVKKEGIGQYEAHA